MNKDWRPFARLIVDDTRLLNTLFGGRDWMKISVNVAISIARCPCNFFHETITAIIAIFIVVIWKRAFKQVFKN